MKEKKVKGVPKQKKPTTSSQKKTSNKHGSLDKYKKMSKKK